jgi:hypothetical protein
MPIHLILYGTDGCHLCEQAHELLLPAIAQGQVTVDAVDILDDPALEERYGVRIPVVRHDASGRELGWPFDSQRLGEFLAEVSTP